MYYCLECKRVHEKDPEPEQLFHSGYTLINQKQVPLGVCKKDGDASRIGFHGRKGALSM